jgi:RNA polymerase sigma-70 factor, ECF subfamily
VSERTSERDLTEWRRHRGELVGLAYRMLGDLARAEDMVQEAWLRWSGRQSEANDPRAFLVAIVTRLCLNELASARSRLEESRADRLPEPVDLERDGLAHVDDLERMSMAFLVLLQRLTPAERAVFILYDVFDFDQGEVSGLVGKSVPACRKLLERARSNVAAEKRMLVASREEHQRLLAAFMQAIGAGDVRGLSALLADDAVLVTDGGPGGRVAGGIRNLDAPLAGVARIAAFLAAATNRNAGTLVSTIRELNGQPALVLWQGGAPFAALLLGVAEGKVRRLYFQADTARLQRLSLGN